MKAVNALNALIFYLHYARVPSVMIQTSAFSAWGTLETRDARPVQSLHSVQPALSLWGRIAAPRTPIPLRPRAARHRGGYGRPVSTPRPRS